MRTATVKIAFVQIICPDCGKLQTNAIHGGVYSIISVAADDVWDCKYCKQKFRIPKSVERCNLKE